MASIVVCGYMLRHPVAGNLLAYFQYVLGLQRLGHDVLYVEESGWPYSCYDPSRREWQDFPAMGLRCVRELLDAHDLDVPVCYVDRESGAGTGMARDELKRYLQSADLLLNIGGVCWLPEFQLCPRRALIDLDPLFTQADRFGAKLLPDYTTHFSYGANIGRPHCTIPTLGVEWLPTVPPVVCEIWPGDANGHGASPMQQPFTTVANWSAYGGIEFEGEWYGQKDEEFIRILDLPARTSQPLELALAGADEGTMERLRTAGWAVRDVGVDIGTDVQSYRSYIAASRGELSAAKNAYVKTRSGWFSDRSVCYLASGRPVILQDTGFGDWLPSGRGVLAFSSVEEAAAGIERVNAEYEAQARAAREIAHEYFDARVVLPRLLERALAQ